MYVREDQADIRVKVAPPPTAAVPNPTPVEYGDGNSWATFAGAALTAAGSKARPGGMGHQKAQGGPAVRADATVTIQNSDAMVSQHGALEALVGRGEVTVTISYLNRNGEKRSGVPPYVVTGILKEVELPGQNYDSPTVGMYKLVVDCDEVSA